MNRLVCASTLATAVSLSFVAAAPPASAAMLERGIHIEQVTVAVPSSPGKTFDKEPTAYIRKFCEHQASCRIDWNPVTMFNRDIAPNEKKTIKGIVKCGNDFKDVSDFGVWEIRCDRNNFSISR
jgi:hypothetical protein